MQGNGGKCTSTLKSKDIFSNPNPISGAYNKRLIPVSEFRRYYDRGDLAIKVVH